MKIPTLGHFILYCNDEGYGIPNSSHFVLFSTFYKPGKNKPAFYIWDTTKPKSTNPIPIKENLTYGELKAELSLYL